MVLVLSCCCWTLLSVMAHVLNPWRVSSSSQRKLATLFCSFMSPRSKSGSKSSLTTSLSSLWSQRCALEAESSIKHISAHLLSWLEHGANDAKIVGLMPIWVIHLKSGLDDPHSSLPTQAILYFCNILYWTQPIYLKHTAAVSDAKIKSLETFKLKLFTYLILLLVLKLSYKSRTCSL